jgi:hypothetical protein
MYIYSRQKSDQRGLSGNAAPTISPFALQIRTAQVGDMRFGPPPDSGRQYQPTLEHPYARVLANFSNITEGADLSCVCYEDMPREEARSIGVMHAEELEYTETPYALEVHLIGHHYICDCRTTVPPGRCPPSIHQGADPADPWRKRRCNEWIENTKQQAAEVIGSKTFRQQLAQKVFEISGLQKWRGTFLPPAEFTQVLAEKAERAKPIKIIAPIVIAAAGSVIIWKTIRKRKK